MTRVGVAHVGLVTGKHQPPVARAGRHIAEPERDDGPSRRQVIEIDAAVHIPQKQLGVEVLISEVPNPADAPRPKSLDDSLQLTTRVGQHVPDIGAVRMPLDEARPHQLLQTLRQQSGVHTGYSASELVEARAARNELADDKHRPALVEQLHRLGHWTELVVGGTHGWKRSADLPGWLVHIPYWRL